MMKIGDRVWTNSDNYDGFVILEINKTKNKTLIEDNNKVKYLFDTNALFETKKEMLNVRYFHLNSSLLFAKNKIVDLKKEIRFIHKLLEKE